MIDTCLLIDVKDRMSASMNQLCLIDNFNSLVYSGGVKDMYAVRVEKKNPYMRSNIKIEKRGISAPFKGS